MNTTLIQLVTVAGGIVTIISLAKLVVEPFNKVMNKINTTLRALELTTTQLSYDIRDSQKDRDNIHKVLDDHELRLGKVEDEVIVNNEQIKTLFNGGMK
ncbi:hypothetical protein [Eremococcus coleocola]|uniref:Uncharacterized protein n=1 Tax=Eremococcus coleocola ACS-139-V-Col8 TaxID=908337 RepID=E4KQG6_9LACT|nr:hypothetical protein [Eremococcus coleocola]EFR30601.1 hypothetical protein HMPREF9257_0522 [Eremococcus coleocola ACS-139-V-Col8]